jgi:hypothetical protein
MIETVRNTFRLRPGAQAEAASLTTGRKTTGKGAQRWARRIDSGVG